MSKKLVSVSLLGMLLAVSSAAFAAEGGDDNDHRKINDQDGIRHVLLISIDGMHAVDFQNCAKGGYCKNLAALAKNGVNYTNTSTSKPSDSFPGLMALVTGGTPRLVGAYYDVAYDRVLAPPFHDTFNGNFSGPCNFGQANGTTTEYEEGVDIDPSKLNGGAPGASLTDGGFQSIDPTKLPRNPFVHDANNGGCAPVYPWNFIRANTIYGVIHAAGGYTAWSDKHGVYAAVSGPTGTALPSNVDDYYAPDVNSDVIGLAGITAVNDNPADVLDCSTPPDAGGAWTDSFNNIRCYDQLKVNAILNEIGGKKHLGNGSAPVPNIFGMNFQAVSVAQKLIQKINGVRVFGGYLDAAGTPSANLKTNIEFVDAAIGSMAQELKKRGLLDKTLIVVTAKHGQSPIDPKKFQELPKDPVLGAGGLQISPATLLAKKGFLPPNPIGGQSENPLTPDRAVPVGNVPGPLSVIGPTEDDISLVWLRSGAKTEEAVDLLQTHRGDIQAQTIYSGDLLEDTFDKPGIPPYGDPRTPDIIVQPVPGVIYTGSSKKQEEHGGFDHDDTNVMILLSNPSLQQKTVDSFVETRQVAPTILKALGLDPRALDAVRKEGTKVLPGVDLDVR